MTLVLKRLFWDNKVLKTEVFLTISFALLFLGLYRTRLINDSPAPSVTMAPKTQASPALSHSPLQQFPVDMLDFFLSFITHDVQ